MLLLLAMVPSLLGNGGFEDGLHGWNINCSLDRCSEVSTRAGEGRAATSSPTVAAALQGTADEWTAVQLRQELQTPLPSGVLALEAWVRAGGTEQHALPPPLEVRLTLQYGSAQGAMVGSCATERDALPATWERLRVRCSPPLDGASRAWVLLEFACVRGAATLLVDDVSVGADSGDDATPARLPPSAPPIPAVVHFVFGLSENFGGKPFGMVHHLVVSAAVRAIRPRRAYFHHAYLPHGYWWERTLPMLVPRRLRPPTTIFGRPVRRFAHQADVVRLELLQQFGGSYLDMDVLLLRSLAPLLAAPRAALVLAHEGIDGTIGAGNALMLAQRNAPALAEWYGRYRAFSDVIWNGFSVRLPMELASQLGPSAIRLLDYTAFYWPPWNPWGVAQLYRTPRCMLPSSCTHASSLERRTAQRMPHAPVPWLVPVSQ